MDPKTDFLCSSCFALAVFVLAVLCSSCSVLAVVVLAKRFIALHARALEKKEEKKRSTVEASPNGGAKLEASPNGGAKVEASPNGGATGSECESQLPYVFPFEAFAQQRGQGQK